MSKPEASIIDLDKSKVVVSYYKDSGKGGQHRNKTLSGVRLQYDDLIITCCDTRDQRKNKEIAFEKLKERLKQAETEKVERLISNQYKTQNKNKGKRGNFDRNYNYPRNEITQNNLKVDLSKFMKGNFKGLY